MKLFATECDISDEAYIARLMEATDYTEYVEIEEQMALAALFEAQNSDIFEKGKVSYLIWLVNVKREELKTLDPFYGWCMI